MTEYVYGFITLHNDAQVNLILSYLRDVDWLTIREIEPQFIRFDMPKYNDQKELNLVQLENDLWKDVYELGYSCTLSIIADEKIMEITYSTRLIK